MSDSVSDPFAATQRLSTPSSANTGYRSAKLPEIEGYRILNELGRGGMGVVYKAWHLGLKRTVALKLLLLGKCATSEEVIRFHNEATAAAGLRHPHIVQIFDIAEHGGSPFFSMEYVENGSLAARLDGTPLSEADAVSLVIKLAQAIHHAHEKGIIHRDLKPANILLLGSLDSTIQKWMPKITDFGIAKRLTGDGQTSTGTILGTPEYMAPEQATGSFSVSPKTDVYALGVVLYELLTGRRPFTASSPTDTIMRVCSEDPVSPRRLQRNISKDLETICLKCLEKNPGRRYESAQALSEDLNRFQNRQPIVARPATKFDHLVKWSKRHPVVASLTTLLVLGAILSISLLTTFWQQAEHKAHTTLEAQKKEKKARQEADAARLEVEIQLANVNLDRAIALADNGNIPTALLLMEQNLRRAKNIKKRGGKTDHLQEVICKNLGAYHQNLFTEQSRLPHRDWVVDVGFCSKGEIAMTASKDGTAGIWETGSGKPLVDPLQHEDPVWTIAGSPDGQWFATGTGPAQPQETSEGVLRIWHFPDRSQKKIDLFAEIKHPASIDTVAFSPDGSGLLSLCWDDKVRVWRKEIQDNKIHWQQKFVLDHHALLTAAVFSPDGRLIATACGDGGIRLWNAKTGEPVGQPMQQEGAVSCLTFSPNGHYLACGTLLVVEGEIEELKSGEAQVWNLADQSAHGPPLAHKGQVKALAFSPDSQILVTGGVERSPEGHLSGAVRLWQVQDDNPLVPVGTLLQDPWQHPAPVWSLAFNPNGRIVLTGCEDMHTRLWHTGTGQLVAPPLLHEGTIGSVAFSPCGRVALSASMGGNQYAAARLSSVPKGQVASYPLRFPQPLDTFCFSPDGKRTVFGCDNNEAYLWDNENQKLIAKLSGHTNCLRGCAFSPDGKKLATGCADGMLRFWDGLTGKSGKAINLPKEGMVIRPLWSSDGKKLITLWHHYFRSDVSIWSAEGDRLANLNGDKLGGRPVSVVFQEKGTIVRISVLSNDYTSVWEWEPAANKVAKLWEHRYPCFNTTFSPDGKLLLMVGPGNSSRFLDAVTGTFKGSMIIMPSKIIAGTFNPDGTMIVLRDSQSRIRFWDVASCRPVGGILRHGHKEILAMVFHPEGDKLSVTLKDSTCFSWDVPEGILGEGERLQTWMELRTGAKLVDRIGNQRLTPEELINHSQRLKATGGSLLSPLPRLQPRPGTSFAVGQKIAEPPRRRRRRRALQEIRKIENYSVNLSGPGRDSNSVGEQVNAQHQTSPSSNGEH